MLAVVPKSPGVLVMLFCFLQAVFAAASLAPDVRSPPRPAAHVSAQNYTPAQAKALGAAVLKACANVNSQTCKAGVSQAGKFCAIPKNLGLCECQRPP